jgi:hypothetical protein
MFYKIQWPVKLFVTLHRYVRKRSYRIINKYIMYICNRMVLDLQLLMQSMPITTDHAVMLWVRISTRARCTTLCDKVCQWLATGWWFSPGPPVYSTNKNDLHDRTEILLKVALNTIKQVYFLLLSLLYIFIKKSFIFTTKNNLNIGTVVAVIVW